MASRTVEIVKTEGLATFLEKASKYAGRRLDFLLLPYALLRVKRFNKGHHSLDALVDFSLNSPAGLIHAAQVRDEILQLADIIEGTNPKTVLEIGTAKGGTLFLFSQLASPQANIISVDLAGGMFGGGYPVGEGHELHDIRILG